MLKPRIWLLDVLMLDVVTVAAALTGAQLTMYVSFARSRFPSAKVIPVSR